MANCNNVIYGILIASSWCILMCCSRLHTRGDVYNRGSNDLHLEYGNSKESYVDQNVYGQGSGDTFVYYGDCRASKMTTYIYNYGSGDVYLLYGYSSESSASVPSNANYPEIWPKNMYTIGSGDFFINYGSCSSSSNSRMVENVYNRGSGDVKIMYRRYTRSKVGHKITNVGSGKVYVKYANQDSYVQETNANVDEELPDNVYNLDSGEVHIFHGKRGGKPSSVKKNASMGKTVNDILSNMIMNLFETRSRRVQED